LVGRLCVWLIPVLAGLILAGSALASSGPTLVKDINPGSASSEPGSPTNFAGALYFAADDGSHGVGLWKSNGTAAGTKMVKDVSPGFLTVVGGRLYFQGYDATHGAELWRSNGTKAGTQLVKNIRPGSSGSGPSDLTNVGGALFFSADDSVHGLEVWRSDGTAAGTHIVKDIKAGAGSSAFATTTYGLTAVGNTAYFAADDGVHGPELWRSDGTKAGTRLVKDINPGSAGSGPPKLGPTELTNVGGTLFFSAHDSTHGLELWKSDGTRVGTRMVKDIWVGSGTSLPKDLTNRYGVLYFGATDGHGSELWTSDGTSAGTKVVWSSHAQGPVDLTDAAGTLYYFMQRPTIGNELWKSNGTAAGTSLVKSLPSGSFSSIASPLGSVGTTLLFPYNDGTHGEELWRSNGTPGGTNLVKDLNPGSASAFGLFSPTASAVIGGTIFFPANDGAHGVELWKYTP
jgi:ELWxxDGT repeat protein